MIPKLLPEPSMLSCIVVMRKGPGSLLSSRCRTLPSGEQFKIDFSEHRRRSNWPVQKDKSARCKRCRCCGINYKAKHDLTNVWRLTMIRLLKTLDLDGMLMMALPLNRDCGFH